MRVWGFFFDGRKDLGDRSGFINVASICIFF